MLEGETDRGTDSVNHLEYLSKTEAVINLLYMMYGNSEYGCDHRGIKLVLKLSITMNKPINGI